MSLKVIATPIGEVSEISMKALTDLKEAKVIIGEEHKEIERLLKRLKIPLPQIEVLNEHSQADDVLRLADLCAAQEVALISDCGTPGFCDPGADLVRECRKRGIVIHSSPGPSSLMAFLSICGHRVDQFIFAGFISPNRENRGIELKSYLSQPHPVIFLDTPYRLGRILMDLAQVNRSQKLVVGINLGFPDERIEEGDAQSLAQKLQGQKAEFVLMALPLQRSLAPSLNLKSLMRSRKKSRKKYRPK